MSQYILKVGRIECRSQYGVCSFNVNENIQKLRGTTYKQFEKSLQKTIENLAEIEDYNYYFVVPDTLHINVIEKKAEVAIKPLDASEFTLVSRTYDVIQSAPTTVLPIIYTEGNSLPQNSKYTEFALSLAINLFQYYKIHESILDGNSLQIVYNEHTKVIFPLEGDIDVLLGSFDVMLFQLNQALEDSKIDNVSAMDIQLIDLRYKNPIIK